MKSHRYDLSRMGRYRMNRKLSLDVPMEEVTLTGDINRYGKVFNVSWKGAWCN